MKLITKLANQFSKSSSQCHYKTLNVSANCSFDDIKQSYLKLAKKYHPDIMQDGNQDKFTQIQQAYQILSDEQKRLDYDVSQGLRSEWKHYQGFDASFGEQQDKYSYYYSRTNQQQSKGKDDYQHMNEYFQKKYFQNHSYYTVFDENVDDPYRATPHLMEKMNLKKSERNKNPKYKLYYGFQKTPYYADIYEKKYEGDKYTFLLVLYDLRHPILLILSGITIYQTLIFFQNYNKDKKSLDQMTQVTQGKGTVMKTIPLNIV